MRSHSASSILLAVLVITTCYNIPLETDDMQLYQSEQQLSP